MIGCKASCCKHYIYTHICFRIVESVYGDYVCPDGRDCTVTYEFAPQCTIFVQDDDHPDCQVPCKTELCKEELHYDLPNCPIYFCTFPSTPTEPTTTTTKPAPPSPISPAGYGSSVAINVIFGALFVSFCLTKIFKKREPFRPIIRGQTRHGFENPTFQVGRDAEENDPLLASLAFSRRSQHRTNDFDLQNFEAAASRMIDRDDPATFEPSAPPPPYASCAPSISLAPAASSSSFGTSITIDPNDHPLDQALDEAMAQAGRAPSGGRFVSAFDRWFRNKKSTVPLEDVITDDDL